MSYLGNSPGVASQRIVTTFTATAGQTTFTPSSGYALGYCDVFQNGVKLVAGDDYTASNGTTVVLATGASAGDSVEVVAYIPRGLSDGYTKAETDARHVLKSGDTMTGNLIAPRVIATDQSGGVQWNGDIDGAKWSTKLGGYFLSFLNPNAGSTANLEASPISLDGLSWRSKARLHPDGYIEVAQGVKFPAAQNGSADANILDDYEEGSWTPVLANAGTVNYVAEYTGGKYTKIGNRCFVSFEVRWDSRSGGSGDVYISGLPFARVENTKPDADRGVVEMLGGSFTGNGLLLHLGRSSTAFMVMQVISGGNLALQNTQLGTSGTNFLRGTITYCTNI